MLCRVKTAENSSDDGIEFVPSPLRISTIQGEQGTHSVWNGFPNTAAQSSLPSASKTVSCLLSNPLKFAAIALL